jgi:hypothetical protein
MASAVRRPGSSTGQDSATSELDELHRRSKKARSRFEPQWFLNCAYYNGDQWMKFDGGRLYQPSLEAWRLKPVDNRIQPVVRTEIAKMTKTRPDFAVTPTASDEEDIRAAAMGERVLDWLWKELDLTRKLRAGLLWSRICGAGFWKVCWDPTKGDMVEVLANLGTGQVLKDSNNRPMALHRLGEDFDPSSLGENVGKKQISRGDVAVEVRTPFEIFPDPLVGEEGLSAAEWVIEEVVQSEEYVLRRFNTEVEADTDAINGIAESRMPAPGLAGAAGETAKGVKVRELWALPSSKHPQGRHVVWVKDRVLQEEANPYPWLPYIMFRGIPVPGRFWPGSVTEQLISPQTELNKRKAQIGENAARIGNPRSSEAPHRTSSGRDCLARKSSSKTPAPRRRCRSSWRCRSFLAISARTSSESRRRFRTYPASMKSRRGRSLPASRRRPRSTCCKSRTTRALVPT